MSAEFRAKIEGSEPLPVDILDSTSLAEDIQEDYEGNDDEDVPLSLSSAQVVRRDTESLMLPSGFQTVNERISYNEEWDEKADLMTDSHDTE